MIIFLIGKFIICFAAVVFLGIRLSQYADTLSKKSLFSEYVMGILFLSAVTSFPEIFTAIGAVKVVFAPNMAVSDVIGSIIFNLAVIAFLEAYFRKPLLPGANKIHVATAACTIVMILIFIVSVVAYKTSRVALGLFNVHAGSYVLILVYLGGTSFIYNRERSFLKENKRPYANVKGSWAGFTLVAVTLIASSLWLAKIGKSIVEATGLTEIAVGTFFLAITTSLPEIVVSASAFRIGSANLALGNILGSNFFNMFIIAICDAFVREGNLVSFLTGGQVGAALTAAALSAVIMLGVLAGRKKRLFGVSWYVPIILSIAIIWYAMVTSITT